MIANTGKHHPLFNSNDETYPIKVGNRKLLGIKIDKELNFNEHVQSLCEKASQKINTSRVVYIMNFEQR